MSNYAWVIPILPFAAFLIIVAFTRKDRAASALTAVVSMLASFILSLIVLFEKISSGETTEIAVSWFTLKDFGKFINLNAQVGILIDPLTSVMLTIVTFVALLVTLYSMGYMKEDEGYARYFAYLGLFASSMLGLVISPNYLQMFVFWELVGLSSYLLIGFWFHKPSAAEASKKAFITNRWADFGFLLGIILIFAHFGTFNFAEISELIASEKDAVFITLAGILVFIGVAGKSAQFPLHIWLPDAMEGPTPVSALIHAATMVAAGVFLLARGFVLFSASETVMTVIAYTGGFTALFSASIALVQRDIKRILAFSTLSQLGYMVMALGAGSMTSGVFHLTTHAFFKALLFLGAGSVIHAINKQDIFEMGGLKRKMPVTACTFVIGTLALSGIFPLSGFWSKDGILSTILQHNHMALFILAIFVAFLTPLYMFRLVFTVFAGEEKKGLHAHEASWVMTLPLILLSIFSVIAGFINTPLFYKLFGGSFGTYVFYVEPEAPHVNLLAAGLSTLAALAAIAAAWLLYVKKAINLKRFTEKHSFSYKLLYNKFYIDEIYKWLYDKVLLLFGRTFDWFDKSILDGAFDGFGKRLIINGSMLRRIQTGRLQTYLMIAFAAIILIAALVSG